jgi:hypothetical protein
MSLNNAYAPSTDDIIEKLHGLSEDKQLEILSEIASYDYQCPDKCDQWAIDFLEDHYDDIKPELDYDPMVKADLDLDFYRGK